MASSQEPGNHEKENALELETLTAYIGYDDVSINFPIELLEVTGDLSKFVAFYSEDHVYVPYLRLIDEDPEIIQLLIDWAHAVLARKRNLRTDNSLSRATSVELLELYTLAYRYNIFVLRHKIMKAMFRACDSKVWWQCSFSHNRSPLARFVERVPEDTPMRQFLVNFLMQSAVAASRSNVKFLTDNIPDQLLRLAFTKIVELPLSEYLNWKGADENFGVEGYILDDSD